VPTSFKTPADFRAWLDRHHSTRTELIMRLFKVHAKHRGIGYREALDEALCFGWIDGIVRRLDEDSFTQRFTPRRRGSRWSQVNIKRFGQLKAASRVHPAGQAAFDAWNGKAAGYSFESRNLELDPAFVKTLRAAKKAWAFYQTLPPGYRRTMTFWIMSAKRDETRATRFATFLDHLKKARRIPLM
jgi:uncharacterized protein YdeI (YjbR/CyaY-like superfamily)